MPYANVEYAQDYAFITLFSDEQRRVHVHLHLEATVLNDDYLSLFVEMGCLVLCQQAAGPL